MERRIWLNTKNWLFPPPPPPPPTSPNYDFYGLTNSFTRLTMKTKYVCYSLDSLYVNFHDNRTKWTVTSNTKICRWGEKEKEPKNFECKCCSYNICISLNGSKWFLCKICISFNGSKWFYANEVWQGLLWSEKYSWWDKKQNQINDSYRETENLNS